MPGHKQAADVNACSCLSGGCAVVLDLPRHAFCSVHGHNSCTCAHVVHSNVLVPAIYLRVLQLTVLCSDYARLHARYQSKVVVVGTLGHVTGSCIKQLAWHSIACYMS